MSNLERSAGCCRSSTVFLGFLEKTRRRGSPSIKQNVQWRKRTSNPYSDSVYAFKVMLKDSLVLYVMKRQKKRPSSEKTLQSCITSRTLVKFEKKKGRWTQLVLCADVLWLFCHFFLGPGELRRVILSEI